MDISALGIGSGINIRELVDKLIEAEGRDKKVRFNLTEAKGMEKITAYELIGKTLSEFKEKVSQLQVDPLDKEAFKKSIEEFVQSYNVVFNSIRNVTAVDKTGLQENGILVGDATTRNLEMQMRRLFCDSKLSLVGITSDAMTGSLVVDEKMLEKALTNDPVKASALFMDATQKTQKLVDIYVSNRGFIQTSIDAVVNSLKKLTEERSRLEMRLQKTEERLISQFIAMDKVVARLKSTGEFLSTQLQSLPDPLSTRRS